MGKIIFNGDVRDNMLSLNLYLPDELNNQNVIIEVRKANKQRSNNQNNWYFGIALPLIIQSIVETTGEVYTKEDLHEFHLEKVVEAHKVIKETLGETIITYTHKRTSDMTTVEFMEFKEKIQVYWAERGINVPDPNQKDFI